MNTVPCNITSPLRKVTSSMARSGAVLAGLTVVAAVATIATTAAENRQDFK